MLSITNCLSKLNELALHSETLWLMQIRDSLIGHCVSNHFALLGRWWKTEQNPSQIDIKQKQNNRHSAGGLFVFKRKDQLSDCCLLLCCIVAWIVHLVFTLFLLRYGWKTMEAIWCTFRQVYIAIIQLLLYSVCCDNKEWNYSEPELLNWLRWVTKTEKCKAPAEL